jgi:hypothetical protein
MDVDYLGTHYISRGPGSDSVFGGHLSTLYEVEGS